MYKNLTDFLSRIQSFLENYRANYMIVTISIDDKDPEIIINPRSNFEAKMSYYKNAYNEDLTLKANPNVRIVDYDFCFDLSEYFF